MEYVPKDGFHYYYNLVDASSIIKVYSSQTSYKFLTSITERQSGYRYHPSKWSIKQIVGHMIDHERIKIYRAFELSRKLNIELWGYDQNYLVENGRFDEIPYSVLIEDYSNVRQASESFLSTLSPSQLLIKGMAKNFQITLEEFLTSIIGHEIHHINIIKEKYL